MTTIRGPEGEYVRRAWWLVGFLALLSVLPSVSPTAPSHPLSAVPQFSGSSSTGVPVALSVDLTGANVSAMTVTASARWGSAPANCTLDPVWTRWFWPANSSVAGTFDDPNASSTTVALSPLESGPYEVGARAAVAIDCSSGNTTEDQIALARGTDYAPLTLTNLSVRPGSQVVSDWVTLTTTLEGGLAPYELNVSWGDGTFGEQTVGAPGTVRFLHTYGAGVYIPSVQVTDQQGATTEAVAPEPVAVSNGTTAWIAASVPEAEAGQPVSFATTVVHPVGPSHHIVACGSSVDSGGSGNVSDVVCTPSLSGPFPVSVVVEGLVASQTFRSTYLEPVAGALALGLRATPPVTDVGVASVLRVTVTGGVAPFWITLTGPDGVGRILGPEPVDGDLLLPWTPSANGLAVWTGSVTDGLGVEARAANLTLAVAPKLALEAQASVWIGAASSGVGLRGSVSGGSAPYLWTLSPGVGFANSSSMTALTGVTSWSWSASRSEEGVVNVTLGVFDDAGAWTDVTESVALPAAPTVRISNVSVAGASPSWVNFTLDPTGGVPPYQGWVNVSNATEWSARFGAGATAASARVTGSGNLTLAVALRDARGVDAQANLTLDLPAAAPSPPGPPPPSAPSADALGLAALVAALVAVAAGSVWILRRRRAPSVPAPGPDAERVLEDLLRPADGADRVTVELLAEERGVPLERARQTLDRLIAEGRVRSEREPDGGEILAWELE